MDTDVLIVGADPAGLMLAGELIPLAANIPSRQILPRCCWASHTGPALTRQTRARAAAVAGTIRTDAATLNRQRPRGSTSGGALLVMATRLVTLVRAPCCARWLPAASDRS